MSPPFVQNVSPVQGSFLRGNVFQANVSTSPRFPMLNPIRNGVFLLTWKRFCVRFCLRKRLHVGNSDWSRHARLPPDRATWKRFKIMATWKRWRCLEKRFHVSRIPRRGVSRRSETFPRRAKTPDVETFLGKRPDVETFPHEGARETFPRQASRSSV